MPRVSVVMPTFNCAAFIGAALKSVFAQSYRDYEVVVVDDGSTDDTAAALDPCKGKIRYLRQENQGPAAARNLAVASSGGELIAFLDADDLWRPDKLARQVAFLDDHPTCALVHGEVDVIDESGRLLCRRYDRQHGRPVLRGPCVTELLKHSVIHMPTVIERRRHFDEAGGFDENLRYAEDYLHWIRLALNGHSFGYLGEPLALYRWRAGSLTRNGATEVQRSESLLTVYRRVLADPTMGARLEANDRQIVQEQIVSLHRGLAYAYRKLGQAGLARRHSVEWMRATPGTAAPYVEWLKGMLSQW